MGTLTVFLTNVDPNGRDMHRTAIYRQHGIREQEAREILALWKKQNPVLERAFVSAEFYTRIAL